MDFHESRNTYTYVTKKNLLKYSSYYGEFSYLRKVGEVISVDFFDPLNGKKLMAFSSSIYPNKTFSNGAHGQPG